MQKYADVDVLLSGIQGDLRLNFPVKSKKHGLGFIFGKTGGIDYWRTLFTLKPFRFFYDVFTLDIKSYDLIISDFEPISTWAAKWSDVERVGLSHQASFLDNKTPRPRYKNYFGEFIYHQFAPVDRYVGLHYKSYGKDIYTPIVRKEIRELELEENDHVVVYLPAFSEQFFMDHLKKVAHIQWKVFSKHSDRNYKENNVEVFPIDNKNWMRHLSAAYGAIIGGGFASTSEMLYLGKRFLVIPMPDQYEQVCNAVALQKMGVQIVRKIDHTFSEKVKNWLATSEPVKVDFPEHSEKLVKLALGVH
jgi:uncharacterized protein (TIGR00661 family)